MHVHGAVATFSTVGQQHERREWGRQDGGAVNDVALGVAGDRKAFRG